MKTIGVIGGFGPQATMEFQARIHAIAQRRIPPDGIRGYPPMIVYYHRNLPVACKPDGSPETPYRVSPDLAGPLFVAALTERRARAGELAPALARLERPARDERSLVSLIGEAETIRARVMGT